MTVLLICVVNEPLQTERPSPGSCTVPKTFSVTVVPVPLFVRINGDGAFTKPELIEQEPPVAGVPAAQSVATPGPTARRSKCRPGAASAPPINDMNPSVPTGDPAVRSLMLPVPAKVGRRLPTLLVMFVPIPTWRQAVGVPIDQSISDPETVTPPPAQLATDKWPIIDAEAEGAHRATTAKLKSPNFRP